jgi:O-glycosyl hydrolase
MKTNNNANNGGYLCDVSGQTCSTGNWIQAYANYLTQYVKDYQSSGVTISHVGFLNEADASFPYDSMRSDGTQAAKVITVLRATLDAAGFTSVLINCCDFEGWSLSQTVLQQVKSAGAIDKLGGLTSHGYAGAPGAPFAFSNLPVWQTEWADPSSAWVTSFSSGGTSSRLTWAQRIQSGVTTSNLSAFLYWIGAEPAASSSSAMLVQWTSTSVTASKTLGFRALCTIRASRSFEDQNNFCRRSRRQRLQEYRWYTVAPGYQFRIEQCPIHCLWGWECYSSPTCPDG